MFIGPFEFDSTNQCLRRDGREVPIKPKVFQLLRFLLERRGRLVTKQELLDGLWADAAVSDAVLKVSIRELRIALDDSASKPQYVETLHRRGYRLIASSVRDQEISSSSNRARRGNPTAWMGRLRSAQPFVGRKRELAELEAAFRRSLAGERQVVFVTGDPGTGKTALLTEFAQRVSAPTVQLAVGRCLEHHGTSESYLPILDAISDLVGSERPSGSSSFAERLMQRAPTWVLQIPGLVSDREREDLLRKTFGTTPERMMREMGAFLEEVSRITPFLLILEDLHWSDASTIDLLHYLAIRTDPCQLMIAGTHRPADVIATNHPLRRVLRELSPNRLATEQPVSPLSQDDVIDWLTARFPGNDFASTIEPRLRERTGGNPLFLLHVMDDLVRRGAVHQTAGSFRLTNDPFEGALAIPDTLRQVFERETERLTPTERRALDAASVVGNSFSAAEVALTLATDEIELERSLDQIVQRGPYLRPGPLRTLPNGTVTPTFEFSHALLQAFLYDDLPAAQRARFHSRSADAIEATFGVDAEERSAALAEHRERAHELERAIAGWTLAATHSTRRHAYKEGVSALLRALTLTDRLEPPKRNQLRIDIEVRLGLLHRAHGRMAEAVDCFTRAIEGSKQAGATDEMVTSMLYRVSALSWLDRDAAIAAIDQLEASIDQVEDRVVRAHARGTFGYWRFLFHRWVDDDFAASRYALHAARDAGNLELQRQHHIRLSYFLCLKSAYREALQHVGEGERLALLTGDSFDYLLGRFFSAWSLLHVGEWGELATLLDESEGLARRNGHEPWGMMFRLQRGWLHEHLGDFERATEFCLEGARDAARLSHPLGETIAGCLLAYVHLGRDDLAAARATIESALEQMDRTPPLMGWIWRIHLRHGLSELLVREGNLTDAREAALATIREASVPGERIYLALAERRLAEIALAEGNPEEAKLAIDRAIQVLAGEEIPFAGWRVYDTAARVARVLKEHELAEGHHAQSSHRVQRLLESLEPHPSLRARFLVHPELQHIFGPATQGDATNEPRPTR